MLSTKPAGIRSWSERLVSAVSHAIRSAHAPLVGVSVLLVCGIAGLFLGFSNTYFVVIQTAISVITFLMVLILERTQTKEYLALQLKLNEIVGALKGANNRLIDVENLTDEEMKDLHGVHKELARKAESELDGPVPSRGFEPGA